MANHKGAVPEWLNSQYIENVLKKSEKSEDLQVLNVNITPGSVDGDNYACQIFRITAEYTINNQNRKVSIIGKYKVKTKLIDSIENCSDIFNVEASFFNEMPTLFKKVLNKTEIDFLPKCYSLALENNIIIMEDLVALNYKLQPRGIFLNTKQCALVVESLAEMHGASFRALKIQPDLATKYTSTLFDQDSEGPLGKIINGSLNGMEKYVKIFGLSPKLENELLKLRAQMKADWFKVRDFKEGCLNFLCHGDCWKNNMMFHENGEKVKLLDFQIYNYNSFANDLQYFLFTSASPDTIVNDIDYLLETYYKKLHSVAPEIPNLTLDRVKKEFSERYFFGYILSVVFRSIMSSDSPPDMEKVMEGEDVDMGFDSETYLKHLPILMAFFEKQGVFQ